MRGQKTWEESKEIIPEVIRVDSENFRIDPVWLKDRFTVVYSADLHDATSGMLAEPLVDAGFRNVQILRGGFEAWQSVHNAAESK